MHRKKQGAGAKARGAGERGVEGESSARRGSRPATFSPKAPPAGDRPLKTLERVVSKAGLGSRSEARKWIGAGRVKVNGRVEGDPNRWIDLERDAVTVDDRAVEKAAPVYLLLHKPAGYLTTYRDPEGRPTIYALLPDREQYLFPVGRLDLDTSGLLILTNDTAFAERMTNPEYHVPKTYVVKASKHLPEEQLQRLRDGVELRDGPTRPALVSRLRDPGGKTVFEITITEGRNRQVRRMVEALDAKVISLARVALGDLTMGDLPEGQTRALTGDEVARLREGRGAPQTQG